MRKAYLLVYGGWSREQMMACLNSITLVEKWRYDIPNSCYIISSATAQELSTVIRNKLGPGRFLITEIGSNSQGWLTKASWYLINNKVYLKE